MLKLKKLQLFFRDKNKKSFERPSKKDLLNSLKKWLRDFCFEGCFYF